MSEVLRDSLECDHCGDVAVWADARGMYEALRGLIELSEIDGQEPCLPGCECAWSKARAALAKVEGK